MPYAFRAQLRSPDEISDVSAGALVQGPGWRWVMFVNPIACALIVPAVLTVLPAGRPAATRIRFDLPGSGLVTGGMLLPVFALVRAPIQGWGATATWLEFAGAAVLLAAFVATERFVHDPILPLSTFRIRGLAAANVTGLVGFAGMLTMFFFLTLYMQEVLHFSPIQAGAAYLPVTACLAIASGVSSQLFSRIGTRPVIVGGALLSAGGIYYLSRVPLHGSYAPDLLPGLIIMSVGFGGMFVGVTTAANAGVPANRAGLAAGLLSTSQQLGMALGLAILSAIATSRTHHLLAAHAARPDALTSGYQRALLVCSVFVLAAAVIASRIPNARAAAQPLVVPEAAPV